VFLQFLWKKLELGEGLLYGVLADEIDARLKGFEDFSDGAALGRRQDADLIGRAPDALGGTGDIIANFASTIVDLPHIAQIIVNVGGMIQFFPAVPQSDQPRACCAIMSVVMSPSEEQKLPTRFDRGAGPQRPVDKTTGDPDHRGNAFALLGRDRGSLAGAA
jgi:hypothetical protein